MLYVVILSLAGEDYTISTALMFNLLSPFLLDQSSSFNVDIFNDMIQEDNETFNIAIRLLPSCVSLSLDASSSTVTIIGDDVSVRFTQDQFTGSEATGFVLVNLELTGGTSDSTFDVFVILSEQSPASAEGIYNIPYMGKFLANHTGKSYW